MTPRNLILQAVRSLKEAGVPDPETDAALLLSFLTGLPPLELRMDMEHTVSAEIVSAYGDLIGKRQQRIPLQYLTESVRFHGLDFRVDSRVLIPRPETEQLVDWGLEILKNVAAPAVLDLCCGSGCIGLSIRAARSDAAVTLTDLSEEALAVARGNAEQLRLRVEFLHGNFLQPVRQRSFDLILTNPPYIPTGDLSDLQREVRLEPIMALDGGTDGMDFYRRLAAAGALYLNPGGALLMELGIGEGEAVSALFRRTGAIQTELRKDFAGIDRMLLVRFGE